MQASIRSSGLALSFVVAATLAACATAPPPTATPAAQGNASEDALEAVRRAAGGGDAAAETPAPEPSPPPPDPSPPNPPEPTRAASSDFTPSPVLPVCPRGIVSNAPAPQGTNVSGYKPFVLVNDAVRVAVNPTSGDTCLSSGFGPRWGSQHKGVDYRSDPPGNVYAAAPGRVLEALFRNDFGVMIVIDHGNGVYTRYAHLARLADEIRHGVEVDFGTYLGPVGSSGGATSSVHLHYELLIGDYDNPKRSFGLTPISPFSRPYVD
ncbi:MAG: M23 family metallopeptidase [Pseudomonadota bacterium]